CGAITADYIFSIIISASKRTMARCAFLAVAMGFGVVSPTLPRRTVLGIAALGVLYFAFSIAADVYQNTVSLGREIPWLDLPVNALNIIFLMAILMSLSRLLQQLQSAHQDAKLSMYRKLYRVFIGNAAFALIIWLVCLSMQMSNNPNYWRVYFLYQAQPAFTYMAFLMAVRCCARARVHSATPHFAAPPLAAARHTGLFTPPRARSHAADCTHLAAWRRGVPLCLVQPVFHHGGHRCAR
ncbi:hypothetical protein EON62_03980, partial [archaeon]